MADIEKIIADSENPVLGVHGLIEQLEQVLTRLNQDYRRFEVNVLPGDPQYEALREVNRKLNDTRRKLDSAKTLNRPDQHDFNALVSDSCSLNTDAENLLDILEGK